MCDSLVRQGALPALPVDFSLVASPANQHDLLQTTVVDRPSTISIPSRTRRKVPVRADAPLMERAWNLYSDSCACGTVYANNCAHFLTNAFALAGASFPANSAKCPKGRMIRAKEALEWFRSLATGFKPDHQAISGGYWFVYQEISGQGHVCMHLESPEEYSWVGTGDYDDWPVQWHYCY
jgi:hypothetical protein